MRGPPSVTGERLFLCLFLAGLVASFFYLALDDGCCSPAPRRRPSPDAGQQPPVSDEKKKETSPPPLPSSRRGPSSAPRLAGLVGLVAACAPTSREHFPRSGLGGWTDDATRKPSLRPLVPRICPKRGMTTPCPAGLVGLSRPILRSVGSNHPPSPAPSFRHSALTQQRKTVFPIPHQGTTWHLRSGNDGSVC